MRTDGLWMAARLAVAVLPLAAAGCGRGSSRGDKPPAPRVDDVPGAKEATPLDAAASPPQPPQVIDPTRHES